MSKVVMIHQADIRNFHKGGPVWLVFKGKPEGNNHYFEKHPSLATTELPEFGPKSENDMGSDPHPGLVNGLPNKIHGLPEK